MTAKYRKDIEMPNPAEICCERGLCSLINIVEGDTDLSCVVTGMVKKAHNRAFETGSTEVEEMTDFLSEGEVTLQDVMGVDLEVDPVLYYRAEDKSKDIGGGLTGERIANAVAICIDRARQGGDRELDGPSCRILQAI